MSLPAYSEYRGSGIDWVERLPAHWDVASLKWICHRYSGGTPDKNRLEFWEDGTVPWLNSGAVNDGRIYEPSAYITQEALGSSSAKWIPAGALLMALAGQGKTKGMVAQLMFQSTCNQSMAAIVPAGRIEARYLYWWLASNYQNIRNMAGGDLRDGLNLDLLGAIPCPLPSGAEQATIAAFLDCETAKIDALIAEQEKLLALLAEKRQATISHAVTRGLDPNAPMKDTGIPWLGEVPAHWEIGTVKRFFTSLDGRRIPLSAEERSGRQGEFPYYGASGVIDTIDAFIFDEDLVLVSEDGANLLNRSTPIAFVATGKYWVNNHAHILKPLDEHLVFWAERIEALDLAPVVTGSAQPKLTVDALMNLPLSVPPTSSERAAITAFIQTVTSRIDALKRVASQGVELLKQRRSALIAAAVTGQVDVRGAEESQAA